MDHETRELSYNQKNTPNTGLQPYQTSYIVCVFVCVCVCLHDLDGCFTSPVALTTTFLTIMSSQSALLPAPPGGGGGEQRLDARPASANSQRSMRPRTPRGRKEVGMIGQASWLSSVINLVNTIVGAGVLAMPAALSRMGITLGVFIILWSGLTAGFGLYLQTLCARYLDRGAASFFALSQITYPNAAVLFDAAIAVKCFGVGVSYLIIIGDLMPGVVRGFSEDAGGIGFLVDRHFWVTGFM